ncbi:MAG: pre-toxin TG domain-containing protein, partial [Bacteroidetes bacterium]|nr:pre-toxin TG domain-containing protein [Bacteroidota bacterium]
MEPMHEEPIHLGNGRYLTIYANGGYRIEDSSSSTYFERGSGPLDYEELQQILYRGQQMIEGRSYQLEESNSGLDVRGIMNYSREDQRRIALISQQKEAIRQAISEIDRLYWEVYERETIIRARQSVYLHPNTLAESFEPERMNLGRQFWGRVSQFMIRLTPIIGTTIDIIEIVTGRDVFTGTELSAGERVLTGVLTGLSGIFSIIRFADRIRDLPDASRRILQRISQNSHPRIEHTLRELDAGHIPGSQELLEIKEFLESINFEEAFSETASYASISRARSIGRQERGIRRSATSSNNPSAQNLGIPSLRQANRIQQPTTVQRITQSNPSPARLIIPDIVRNNTGMARYSPQILEAIRVRYPNRYA